MKKTDSEIQQAVLRELKWDTRVEETDVGVEVDAGVVTLTGTVSNWGKRIAAQQAAHRVAGVLERRQRRPSEGSRQLRADRYGHRSSSTAGARVGRVRA